MYMHVAMLPRAGYICIPCLSYFDLTFQHTQSENILIDEKKAWNSHIGIMQDVRSNTDCSETLRPAKKFRAEVGCISLDAEQDLLPMLWTNMTKFKYSKMRIDRRDRVASSYDTHEEVCWH